MTSSCSEDSGSPNVPPSPPTRHHQFRTKHHKKIILIVCANTAEEVKCDFGEFRDRVSRAAGVCSHDDVASFAVYAGATLPTVGVLEHYRGIVISGSNFNVTEHLPWMEETAKWLRMYAGLLPTLGICFGHQLLAYAFGGEVQPNPRGKEAGTKLVIPYEHSEASKDRLLHGLSFPMLVHENHAQSVMKLPPGTVPLLHNDHDACQCVRFKDNVWGLQFHPEFCVKYASRILKMPIVAAEELLKRSPGLSPQPESNPSTPRGPMANLRLDSPNCKNYSDDESSDMKLAQDCIAEADGAKFLFRRFCHDICV